MLPFADPTFRLKSLLRRVHGGPLRLMRGRLLRLERGGPLCRQRHQSLRRHSLRLYKKPLFSPASALGLILLVSTVISGCDSAPGPTPIDASPPFVEDIQVSPDVLALDQIGGEGDTVTASITVSAQVTDENEDLSTFFVIIRSALSGQTPLAQAEIPIPSSGRMQAILDLTVSRAEAGRFTVSVFASDIRGLLSNIAYHVIDVSASSEPPVIEDIIMPDRVTRPAAGEAPISIPLIVEASDPDGLENIAFVQVIVNGGATLRLCDDGGQGVCNAGFGASSGDLQAGDARFTLTIQLESTNSPGTYSFDYSVVDRSGLRSAVETRTLVVE